MRRCGDPGKRVPDGFRPGDGLNRTTPRWSVSRGVVFQSVRETHSVLSHRGAAMVDKTWLDLAAERGVALATWGLYPSDLCQGEARRGEKRCWRETVAVRGAERWGITALRGCLISVGAHHPRPGSRARLFR